MRWKSWIRNISSCLNKVEVGLVDEFEVDGLEEEIAAMLYFQFVMEDTQDGMYPHISYVLMTDWADDVYVAVIYW